MASILKSKQWMAFAVTAALLGTAAVGLNTAVAAFKVYFKKEPVSLRKQLLTLPKTLGTWEHVTLDGPLPHDTEEALGTKEYIFRYYVDRSQVPDTVFAGFNGKTKEEREKYLMTYVQPRYPSAVINCAVTYYTGMVDTVAHVPDRCYIADGYQPATSETKLWPAGEYADGNERNVDVRVMNFEDQTGRARRSCNVVYLFSVNGQYKSNPIDVRSALQDLSSKYAYYAKVELMTNLDKPALAEEVMQRFAAVALPEVEKCLPDWNEVIQGRTVKGESTITNGGAK